ncbi:MAG: BrnA antitoxin family protein [Thiobacillus sp.]
MPKLKPGTIIPTPQEEARIQAGIDADPDAYSLSDEEWEKVKPIVRIGRPKAEVTKERITIRLSRDVVTQFRATGEGWQTRMDSALRQFIAEHPISR